MTPATHLRLVALVRPPIDACHDDVGVLDVLTVHEWIPALAAWTTALRAAARPDTTIYLRLYQLRRVAAGVAPTGPWTVTGKQLVDWVAGQNWSRETRRSYRSAIRSFYRWAADAGHITIDPSLALPPVDVRPPDPRPAPRDVYRAALTDGDERVRLMVQLAAEDGLRRGEVARLHSDDLEQGFDGWYLRVRGKGDRVRRVPLEDTTAAAIRRRGVGYLFPGRIDGHLSPAHVGKLVSRALPGAWSMHSLRHRFATVAYSHDRDMFAVQELLGHSSPNTTRLYVKVPAASLRATVRAVARAS